MITNAATLVKELELDSVCCGWNRWNSFTETILRFDVPSATEETVRFSRDCIAAFDARDPSSCYYPIGQVFEPSVFREACAIQGVPLQRAVSLDYGNSPRLAVLQEERARLKSLTSRERLMLASSLVTISRFDVARHVSDLQSATGTDVRCAFEYALLRYIIGNRTKGSSLPPDAMHEIRTVAARGGVPVDRVLDACSLAVVWYLKGVGVSKDDFAWFANRGNRLVMDYGDRVPALSRSAWFRAVAMLTAELGNPSKTRHLMNCASKAAATAVGSGDGAFAENLYKTYLESSAKEFMYVSRDEGRAVASAVELTKLDSEWSVSAGELADVLAFFGRTEEAARAYDQAASLGVPYVSHHILKAAGQYENAGLLEAAVNRYLLAAIMLPDPRPSLNAACRLSSKCGLSSARLFERFVGRLH